MIKVSHELPDRPTFRKKDCDQVRTEIRNILQPLIAGAARLKVDLPPFEIKVMAFKDGKDSNLYPFLHTTTPEDSRALESLMQKVFEEDTRGEVRVVPERFEIFQMPVVLEWDANRK